MSIESEELDPSLGDGTVCQAVLTYCCATVTQGVWSGTAMGDPQPLDELGKYVHVKDLSEDGVSPVVVARNTLTGEEVAIKRVPRETVKHFQV